MSRFFIAVLTCIIICPALYAQKSISFSEPVMIGGVRQWIEVTGKDASKPLLLFVHGGPGFSSIPYSKAFVKPIEKEFIVAQWDQRETGKTAELSPMKEPLKLESFHSDLLEVVQFLLKKYSKQKLFLAGYSWGGFLGLNLAKTHPELLHAYISISGVIYQNRSESETLRFLKEKSQLSKDSQAIKEVSQIIVPFEKWEDLYFHRKWTAYYSGKKVTPETYPQSLFQQWSTKWMSVFAESSKVNYFELAPEINCPIYFFIGKKDLVSNHFVAEDYYKTVKANKKELIWFDNSPHEIPTDEPDKFARELVRIGKSVVL